LGIAGTKVRLTIQKENGRILDVSLTRGSPEWWAFYDDNERLRKDLMARDKEMEALKKKLRDAEHVMARDRQEIDNLHGQVASLERLNQKMQMDLDREVDLRRRSENMVNALTAEKKHLDDQIENLLKKVSEVTLSFKSAQGLAREMTEKARQSEQGRSNEEKLRKLAEARETKSQSLLLDEIQRRKDAETETSTLQARLQTAEAKLQHQDEMVQRIAKLSGEVNELQGNLIISQNEVDSGKKYLEKMQEENRQLHSKCGDLEVVAMMAKKEATDAKDALTVAHEINASTTSSKDEAIKREGEASKNSVASDANARSILNKQISVESAYDRLKEELAAAVKAANDAEAMAQKDRLAAHDLSNKLNDMTIRLGELKTAKENECALLVAQLSEAEARANDSKQKSAAAEASLQRVSSELTTVNADFTNKLSQANLEKKVVMDKAAQLEADLKRALRDEKDVRAQLLDYEAKVLSSHQEKETTLSELRVAKGQVESLTAENKQLAAEKKAQYLEIEALKAELLKLTQEKSALENSVKDITSRCNEINQQLLDVQTQLRVKAGEAETLAMRVADLENQLSGIPALKKENLAQKSKLRDLEDLSAALKAENARVTEAELKTRSEVNTCHKLIGDLKSQMTEQKVDFINQIGTVKREMEEKIVEACNERDDLKTELDRYYSLPNIVGVGMGYFDVT
jgi:chromosome segregation ATPase